MRPISLRARAGDLGPGTYPGTMIAERPRKTGLKAEGVPAPALALLAGLYHFVLALGPAVPARAGLLPPGHRHEVASRMGAAGIRRHVHQHQCGPGPCPPLASQGLTQ